MIKDVNITITEKDMGWAAIIRETRKFCNGYTQIGYFTSGGDPRTDIAVRAVVNELGATIPVTKKMRSFWFMKFGVHLKKTIIRIPSRPFMKKTFDENQSLIYNQIYEEYGRIVDGKQNASTALSRLGEWYVGLIKLTILKGGFKENSLFTKMLKNSSRPLINNAEMLNSARHIEVM